MVKLLSLLQENRVLLLLFIINILFAFNMNLVNPLQSLFIENLGANVLQISLVISLQGLVSTILMIPSGVFMSKIGKKKNAHNKLHNINAITTFLHRLPKMGRALTMGINIRFNFFNFCSNKNVYYCRS